jgi:hypothetical protein
MQLIQILRKNWTEIDPLGVVLPSLSLLCFPFVFAKALQVPWLQVSHYAPLGTAITAAVALLTYWRNLAFENDRVLSQKAKEALEHAYDTFTAVPTSRRYKWLATSRLLLRFKKLKDQLRTIPYQDACLGDEDFWRHKFYTAISRLHAPLHSVLNPSSPTDVDNQIEPRSALVVLGFCMIDADSIDEVDEFKMYRGVKGRWGLQVDDFFEQRLTL